MKRWKPAERREAARAESAGQGKLTMCNTSAWTATAAPSGIGEPILRDIEVVSVGDVVDVTVLRANHRRGRIELSMVESER